MPILNSIREADSSFYLLIPCLSHSLIDPINTEISMIEFTTVEAPCEGSITEKRSEFIAQLFPAKTEDECREIIETVKEASQGAS